MFDSTQCVQSTGNTMILKILTALHQLTRSLWLSRNKKLHDKKDETARGIQSSEMAEIWHFHANPTLLPMGDRHYCEKSLSQLLCGAPSVRRRWLRHIRQARAAHLHNGLVQTNITNFFTAVKTPRISQTARPLPPPVG
jgi:hypothetical protein